MESHLHSEALKVELRHFAKETLQQELTSLGGRIEVALCSRLQQVLDSWASDTFHATPKSPMSSRNNKSLHDKSIHSLHDKSVHSAYYSSEHNSIKSSSEHNFEEKKSDEDRSSGGKASIETAPPFQPNGSNDIGGKGRQRLSRLTVNQANNLSRLPDQLADRITMRVQESDAVEDKSSWSFRRPKGYGFRDLQTSQLSLNNFKPLAWVSKRLSWVENQDSQTPGEGSLYEVLSPVLSPEVTGDGEHSPSDAQRWTVASNTSRKTRSTHHTVVFAETTMHSPRDMDKSERSTYSRLERMNTDNGDQIEYARYSEAARERAGSNWGRSVQRYSFASKTSEDDSYDIMKSRQYNFLLGFLIIANSIMTGALTEYQAAHHTSAIPWSFRAPELVFASIFALEIGTRICLHGCSFLTKPGWHWNLFDLIVVIMQVGEDAFSLWMELSHSQSESRRRTTLEMKLFPILSFMRSARIFRLARIFHLIAELRMLLASIANSFRSLLWTVVMLLALTYMVAVYITQFVLDHRLRLTRDDSEEASQRALLERARDQRLQREFCACEGILFFSGGRST